MQQSGLMGSEQNSNCNMRMDEVDNNDNIGDYSVSSEDEWLPDNPRQKSSITVLADIHLPSSIQRYVGI